MQSQIKNKICGCSSVVEYQPSKLAMWVRFPSPAPEKVRRASAGLFQRNPPYRVGEIACGGEIALRAVKSASTAGGWISFHFAVKPQNFTTAKPLFHILPSGKIFHFLPFPTLPLIYSHKYAIIYP